MLYVKKLTKTATLPKKATPGAAAYDLYADEDCTVPAFSDYLVATGIAAAIDPGKCGQIWPRSGLDANYRITRGAGLIDSDYRGEIKVLLVNRSDTPFPIKRGERIGQLLLTVAFSDTVIEVLDLPKTLREAGGFGSTGR